MADINVSVTVPAVITATATDPNHITVAVTNPAPVSVTASVGNVGDMIKAVYDTDNSGVVDNAAALGGIAATGFVQTADTSWIDLTDGGSTTLHSHAAVTVADTASIDMSLTGQQISAAAIFGTSATTIAQGNHTHASPANVDPSVADNFVSFSNATGAQKDSGKGLTHLVYTLQCGTGANFTAADSTTYFFGGALTTNTSARSGIYIPLAGTIVSVDVVVFVGAVLATTETSTISLRLNNTTDTTISSDVQANAQIQRYQANTSIAVVAGDFIEWKWVTPVWATNPTNVRIYGVAMVRV